MSERDDASGLRDLLAELAQRPTPRELPVPTQSARLALGHALTEPDTAFVRTVLPRFGPVEDDMWNDLWPLVRTARLERGHHFLRSGERATAFGWVRRGLVRAYSVTTDGKEHNRGFSWEGQPFGSLVDLLADRPTRTFVEALEEVDAIVVDFRDFEALCARDPRWHAFARRITERLLASKTRREHALLVLDAEARYKQLLARAPGIEARVPLYHLASYLGIRHEHLSRIRRRGRAP